MSLSVLQNFLLNLDYAMFELINQKLISSYADLFFPWITDLHKTLVFKFTAIPLLFILFINRLKRSGLTFFIFLILSLSVNDFCGSLVKNHFLRLRPFENPEISAVQKSAAGSKSFYSNHASNMFTFAMYTSQLIPQVKIPFFIFAGVVAYSRIYNGVHYPSDVLVGALVGLLWGYIFSVLAKKIVSYLNSKQQMKESH